MKGWKAESAWLAYLQRTVYPHKWSTVSCRSSAGQGKCAGQRPTFYDCAMQPCRPTNSFYWTTACNCTVLIDVVHCHRQFCFVVLILTAYLQRTCLKKSIIRWFGALAVDGWADTFGTARIEYWAYTLLAVPNVSAHPSTATRPVGDLKKIAQT